MFLELPRRRVTNKPFPSLRVNRRLADLKNERLDILSPRQQYHGEFFSPADSNRFRDFFIDDITVELSDGKQEVSTRYGFEGTEHEVQIVTTAGMGWQPGFLHSVHVDGQCASHVRTDELIVPRVFMSLMNNIDLYPLAQSFAEEEPDKIHGAISPWFIGEPLTTYFGWPVESGLKESSNFQTSHLRATFKAPRMTIFRRTQMPSGAQLEAGLPVDVFCDTRESTGLFGYTIDDARALAHSHPSYGTISLAKYNNGQVKVHRRISNPLFEIQISWRDEGFEREIDATAYHLALNSIDHLWEQFEGPYECLYRNLSKAKTEYNSGESTVVLQGDVRLYVQNAHMAHAIWDYARFLNWADETISLIRQRVPYQNVVNIQNGMPPEEYASHLRQNGLPQYAALVSPASVNRVA